MSASTTKRGNVPSRLDARFFERLFAGAGLAVFACDTEGRILAWNPLGERLFRSQRGRLDEPRLADVLPEEQRSAVPEQLRTLCETREPLEFRTRITEENGQATEYAVWLTPIFDKHDELQCVCVWLNDITARLQLRRAMRKHERLTTLGALAGSVAHHYNNLLCSITTSLEFALNMNTMTAMRRVLRRTADAIARATKLTHQLLAFAQADYRLSDVADLAEIVRGFYEQRAAELASRGIKLDLDYERIPFVPLPRDQFSIVLDNLTCNAIEAMPDGGTLTVALRRRNEDSVALTLTDSGPGIAPEDMEHLFEPFFTTKDEFVPGETRRAGMGLAVTHGLISEMRGTITASNAPGGGAHFELVLPLA